MQPDHQHIKNPLVTAEWLHVRLGDPDLVILDASWYLPVHQRDAKAEFAAGHIQGAMFFDIDAHSDQTNSLPHMLPNPDIFAAGAGAMGISEKSTIVIYDGLGLFSAPRIWWTFIIFGAKNVHILDGGLPAWKAKGFSLVAEHQVRKPVAFQAKFNPALVANIGDVKAALESGSQVVDARSRGRFTGADPEFRPGLKSGHMRGAKNLPQSLLVKDGYLLKGDALEAAFEQAGVDLDAQTINSCGSGLTAATLALGLVVLGKPIGKLYDGSWTEWASQSGAEIVTGE